MNFKNINIAVIDNGQISNTECFGLLESGTDKIVNGCSIFNSCSISKFLTTKALLSFIVDFYKGKPPMT